jgi:malate dehydrogenase (oxaloacetate-decarboxylating)
MVETSDVLAKHKRKMGKIEIVGCVSIQYRDDLATYCTPGVADVSLAIKGNKALAYDYTFKGRTVAIVTDGTRILGLGKIGPEAGLPVMEGKALLLKKYGGVDAIPIGVDTTDEDKIVEFVRNLQPNFGAINIEDIEAPKCFKIVDRLKKEMDIPVFHDDRNGVGVVTLAGLMNALKLAGKKLHDVKIVINGTGAAGAGIAEMLIYAGAKRVYMADTTGLLYKGRQENMNYIKDKFAAVTNPEAMKGTFRDAAKGADVLIGVSQKGAFDKEMIKAMADKPIVFALANPIPEMEYNEALAAGAFIVATGRSDTPNQVNNLSAFPGILRGLLASRAKDVDDYMLSVAAKAVAKAVGSKLSRDMIMPDLTDKRIADRLAANVAAAVAEAAVKQNLARVAVDPEAVRREVLASLKRYRKIEKYAAR